MTDRTASSGRVVCLGRTYCDIVFTGLPDMPQLGRERFASDVAITAGGGAYITAAHLVARGRGAILASRLGLDALSEALMPELHASGIDLGFVERAADAGPQPTVALVQASERAFVSRRAGTARPAGMEAAVAAPGVRHLHIAEFATLHELPDVIALAKAGGLTTSLDPSWDDHLLAQPDLLERCAGIDVFLPNEEETRAITGLADTRAGLERLAQHFPVVALKCGGGGALLAAGNVRAELSAPKVLVVDTTGAGDAFNAGFIDAWLAGMGLSESLAAAIATGSASVGQAGGAPRRQGLG